MSLDAEKLQQQHHQSGSPGRFDVRRTTVTVITCAGSLPLPATLTPTQTPEPITMSVKAAAHDRAKCLLTIA
jgi:hypothetical protein